MNGETPTSNMVQYLKDLDEVKELIQLYIDGSNGDVEKLKKAFHKDAHMMGQIANLGIQTYFHISEFFKLVESKPGMAGPNYKAFIRNIDITHDAGVAVLVETDYLDQDFVDYFSVAKIDGRWQITNKTYTATGGKKP